MEATMPNSLRSLLSVIINVAKPEAVVTLVIRVALPIFEITRCSDKAWFPCFFTSCWYLFIRKIQLGIPITMINGGIRAVRTVISYCNRPKIPKAHITPIITTNMEMIVALKLLKKKKKIKEVTPNAASINFPISSMIFWEFIVLMYGMPEIRTSRPVSFSKFLTKVERSSNMKSLRTEVLTISLSK